LFEFIFTFKIKRGDNISRMEFQVKLTENLIPKYKMERRPLGRPMKTASPARTNTPSYPSQNKIRVGTVI
jgi:hypothetical protein